MNSIQNWNKNIYYICLNDVIAGMLLLMKILLPNSELWTTGSSEWELIIMNTLMNID